MRTAKLALATVSSAALFAMGPVLEGEAVDLASPLLEFSTMLGGTSSEIVGAAALGPDGALWIAASSASTEFPGAPRGAFVGGGEDLVVLRFDPATHQVLSSLWIGGPGEDDPIALVFDADGNPFVAGRTYGLLEATTTIGPAVTEAGHEHGFVARLARDGASTVWVTLLGASGNPRLNDIATTPDGDVVLAGGYASSELPLVNPMRDSGGTGWLARLRNDGTAFVWSTLMGGWCGCVDVAADGTIVVGGHADPAEFPSAARLFGQPSQYGNEGSVIEIDAEGTTVRRAALLGDTTVVRVAAEPDGVVLLGQTKVADFPAPFAPHGAPGEFGDAFLARLDPATWSIARAALFGGSGQEYYLSMSPAPGGVLWLAGSTTSQDLPVLAGIQPFAASGEDGFIMALSAQDFAPRFSTYLGGNQRELGAGLAAAQDGTAWFLGASWSSNFPLQNAVQGRATDAPEYDMFAAHVLAGDAAAAPAAPTSLAADVSDGHTVRLTWQLGSSDESGVAVYRRERFGFSRVGVAAAGVTQWTDASVLADRRYSYAVQAFNDSGGSPASNVVETQVPASLDVVVTSGSARFIPTNLDGISVLELTGTLHPNALLRSGDFDPQRDGVLWLTRDAIWGDSILLEIRPGADGWRRTRHGVRWAGPWGLRFAYDRVTGRFTLRVRSSGFGAWPEGRTLLLASGLDAGETTPVWRPRGRNRLTTP